jgi:hypothetical protein
MNEITVRGKAHTPRGFDELTFGEWRQITANFEKVSSRQDFFVALRANVGIVIPAAAKALKDTTEDELLTAGGLMLLHLGELMQELGIVNTRLLAALDVAEGLIQDIIDNES